MFKYSFLFIMLFSSASFAQIEPVGAGQVIQAEKINALITEINQLKTKPIYVRATTGTNSIAHGTDIPVVFNGSEVDESEAFVKTTGIFTAPKPGLYEVSFNYWLASAAWTAGTYHYAQIEKNGAIYSYCPIKGMTASTMYTGGSCHDFVPLNQGETIQLKFRHNRGSPVAFDNSPTATRLIILEKK